MAQKDFTLNETPVSRKAIDYYNSIQRKETREYYYNNPNELNVVAHQEERTSLF